MTKVEKSQTAKEELHVTSEPNKVIPKLATKVTVARSEPSRNVVLSFVTSLPGEKAYLIERIVLDESTAEELGGLLKGSDAK